MVNLAKKILSDTETFSVNRLNQMFVTRMTGDEMSDHDTNQPLNINCIQDGDGFYRGHGYFIDEDGELHDYFKRHKHLNTVDGGSQYEILQANAKDLITMDHSSGSQSALYYHTKGGGSPTARGTYKDTLDGAVLYVEMTTGNVENDYVNAMYGGARVFFGKPITFQVKYGISHATNILVKMGTSITNVENEAGSGAQILFEFCSSGGNVLMGICSCGGGDRTTDFMDDAVQSVPYGLRFDYYPSSKIDAIDGGGMEVLKDDNLPQTSAASFSSNFFRCGVRSTNTTPKTLRLHAARLIGHSYDSQSGVQGWV